MPIPPVDAAQATIIEAIVKALPYILDYGSLELLLIALIGWRIYKIEKAIRSYQPVMVSLARNVPGIDERVVAEHFPEFTGSGKFDHYGQYQRDADLCRDRRTDGGFEIPVEDEDERE